MKFINIYTLVFFGFTAFIIGCSSGEYDIDQTQVEYVEKTLKYDTIKVLVIDTTVNTEDLNKIPKVSFTFIVQVGAFKVPENFQRFYDEAKIKLGNEVYYVFINELYKIRIGNYINKSDALQMLENVKSKGYNDAFILTVINK